MPYHWAPHLLAPRDLPFERTTGTGERALSYASWPCPPMCIEPALCPHTRAVRDWSLAGDLERPSTQDFAHETVVFRCLHLAYGVGTIPVRDIQAARDRVIGAAAGRGERTFVVATASHCHGLAATMRVTPFTL